MCIIFYKTFLKFGSSEIFVLCQTNEKRLILRSTSGRRKVTILPHVKRKKVFSTSRTYRVKLSRCCRQIIDRRKTFSSIRYVSGRPGNSLDSQERLTRVTISSYTPKEGIISDQRYEIRDFTFLQRIDFLHESLLSHTINSVNYVFQRRRISRPIVKLCSVSRVILAGSLKEIAARNTAMLIFKPFESGRKRLSLVELDGISKITLKQIASRLKFVLFQSSIKIILQTNGSFVCITRILL